MHPVVEVLQIRKFSERVKWSDWHHSHFQTVDVSSLYMLDALFFMLHLAWKNLFQAANRVWGLSHWMSRCKRATLIKTDYDIKLSWRLNINIKSSLCVYLSVKHKTWHISFHFYPHFLFKASIKGEFGLSSIFLLTFVYSLSSTFSTVQKWPLLFVKTHCTACWINWALEGLREKLCCFG